MLRILGRAREILPGIDLTFDGQLPVTISVEIPLRLLVQRLEVPFSARSAVRHWMITLVPMVSTMLGALRRFKGTARRLRAWFDGNTFLGQLRSQSTYS